jgi:hypothetical protein
MLTAKKRIGIERIVLSSMVLQVFRRLLMVIEWSAEESALIDFAEDPATSWICKQMEGSY